MAPMVWCMIADDIDEAYARATGIVQVGKAVGEAGTEMQESAGWVTGHARVAVGSASGDAFEKTAYATDFRKTVERSNKMYL